MEGFFDVKKKQFLVVFSCFWLFFLKVFMGFLCFFVF